MYINIKYIKWREMQFIKWLLIYPSKVIDSNTKVVIHKYNTLTLGHIKQVENLWENKVPKYITRITGIYRYIDDTAYSKAKYMLFSSVYGTFPGLTICWDTIQVLIQSKK